MKPFKTNAVHIEKPNFFYMRGINIQHRRLLHLRFKLKDIDRVCELMKITHQQFHNLYSYVSNKVYDLFTEGTPIYTIAKELTITVFQVKGILTNFGIPFEFKPNDYVEPVRAFSNNEMDYGETIDWNDRYTYEEVKKEKPKKVLKNVTLCK